MRFTAPTIPAGAVGLNQLKFQRQHQPNVGAVTVVAATTLVVPVSMTGMGDGSVLFVVAYMKGTKGATAGDVFSEFTVPGGQTNLVPLNNPGLGYTASVQRENAVPAGAQCDITLSAMYQHIGTGDSQLNLSAVSIGSDLSVAGNDAIVYVFRLDP